MDASIKPYISILKAASDVVYKSKLQTIDDLMVFLDERVDLDAEFKDMVAEFKSRIHADSFAVGKAAKAKKDHKQKRPPSAYNLFIKEAIHRLQETRPELNNKERLVQATKEWQATKQ